MGKTSDRRLKQVLSYKNNHSLDDTCEEFNLSASSIRRYEREANKRGLDINEYHEEPKILVYDIETSPLECYCWGSGKQYIQHENIKKGRSLLSYSAKWLCDDEVISNRVSVEQAHERKDKELVESLHSLLDEAEVVLGHNVKKFDNSVANSRFLVNNLNPPSPYQSIDTYRQIRKVFDFTSNSLDYLSKKLCEDKEDKQDHSMDLWIRCVEGDESALQEMEQYNRADVRVVEDIYFEARPFFKSGVNLGLYYSGDISNRCPRCGSKDIEEGDNHYYTSTGRFKTIKCLNCGGQGRSRFADLTTEQRKELQRTLAR